MKITIEGKTVGDSYPTDKEISFETDYDGSIIISLGVGYDYKVSITAKELRSLIYLMDSL